MFKQKNFKRFDWRTYLKTVVYVSTEEPKVEKKAPAKKVEAPKTGTKKEAEEAPKAEKKAPAKKVATPKKETTKHAMKKTIAKKEEKSE